MIFKVGEKYKSGCVIFNFSVRDLISFLHFSMHVASVSNISPGGAGGANIYCSRKYLADERLINIRSERRNTIRKVKTLPGRFALLSGSSLCRPPPTAPTQRRFYLRTRVSSGVMYSIACPHMTYIFQLNPVVVAGGRQ